jgi:hypothetical protein
VVAHLFAAKSIVGPIFFFGTRWPLGSDLPLDIPAPPRLNFPLDPYRVARKKATFDPEMVLCMLDDFSKPHLYQNIQIHLPPDATRAIGENILAGIRRQFSAGPLAGPKRGAGARVRQAQVALKYLGALKLRHLMSAPKAIRHTEKELDGPLFPTEPQWSRAIKHAEKTSRPYHAEASMLLAAWSDNRPMSGFSYLDGKLEVDWTSSPG